MRQRLLAIMLALSFALGTPGVSRAQDEDLPKIDARLEGYEQGNMALKDAGGTALTWLLLVGLGALCIGVMFINAKRTHLD